LDFLDSVVNAFMMANRSYIHIVQLSLPMDLTQVSGFPCHTTSSVVRSLTHFTVISLLWSKNCFVICFAKDLDMSPLFA